MAEELRPIPGYPGYYASSNGYVVGKEGRVLRPCRTSSGSEIVSLCCDGRRKAIPVARLILLTFVGPPPEGKPLALHGPAGRSCHRLGNLYWGDHKQNLGPDKVRDGTMARGERHGSAKLTAEQVEEIRGLLRGGESLRSIAKRYGVSHRTILFIKKRETWKEVNNERDK